ncbi:MAG: hypothetical protein JKY33_10585 [Bacteroidia bacterium]|nr:hypothetical protein [Bacteroidia bacterium]
MSAISVAFAQLRTMVAKEQREFVIDIYTGLTTATPVDTGRARASWRITKGEIDSSVEPAAKSVKMKKPKVGLARLGESYFITNNLPYIVPLNEGHSEQAGEFFVEKEIQRAMKKAGR